MSAELLDLLKGLDAAALEVIASKGLVRRAGRETVIGAGPVFAVGAARVTIDPKLLARAADRGFPKDALAAAIACDCPATGLCTHGLASLLSLLTQPGPAPAGEMPDPMAEIATLEEAALRDWARAEWWAALDLTPDAPEASAGRVSLRFPGLAQPTPEVVFLPGAGLDGALYKGPPTKRRRIIAAAAIALRKAHHPGWAPEAAGDNPDTVPMAFLATAAREVEAAAAQAPLAPPMIEAALLSLVASSRAENAPRLAASLRGSAAALALLRDPAMPEDLEQTLAVLAETRALIAALTARPNAPDLTGQRRPGQAIGPMKAVALGAHLWSTATGARGLTALLYDPDRDRWFEASDARAAGQDPTFQPTGSYAGKGPHGIAWKGAMGRRVTSETALVDAAGRLDRKTVLQPEADGLSCDDLPQLGTFYRSWDAARAALATRLSLGLSADWSRSWCLLHPAGAALTQDGLLVLTQADGARLAVELPATGALDREDLRAVAYLCEARRSPDGLRFELRSTLRQGPHGKLHIRNVTLDQPGKAAPPASIDLPSPPAPLPARIAQTACQLAERQLRRRMGADPVPEAEALARHCLDLGLETLAQHLRALAGAPSPRTALRLIWVAHRVSLAAHDPTVDMR